MKRILDRKLQTLWNCYHTLWKELTGWRLFLFYILHYTLLFIVLSHFIFAPFDKAGKSFVWNGDGLSQHFTRLVYISQTIHKGVQSLLMGKGWTIPMYDFRTGLIRQDLQIGFPQILAIFCPVNKIDIFYNCYVLINYYLVGLSFSAFGFFFQQKPLPIMIGAIAYSFCGFSIFAGVRHPHFIVPMIFLPLLIIGAEKVLRKEKAYLLLVVVFLSLTTQWGLYFSCMQAIFVIIYIFVRFPDIYQKNRLHELFCLFGRLITWGGTAILLASFVVVPSLLSVLGIGRIGNNLVSDWNMLHYQASYYRNFLLDFTIIPADFAGYWGMLGFSTLTIPAVFLLFVRQEKKERSLRILFIILTVMLSIPAVAYIMSGFSNISNRFCFGYSFCVAAILMFMQPHFTKLSRSMVATVGAMMLIYFAICYFVIEHESEQMVPFIMMFVAGLILLCCYVAGEKGKKWFMPSCLIITCFSVCYSAYLKYDSSQGNYIGQFHKNVYEVIENGQYASLSQSKAVLEDSDLYRVSGNAISSQELGISFYYGLNGLSMYPYFGWSSNFIEWIEEMELTRSTNKQKFYSLNNCSALLTLANVKYYADRETDVSIIPYGFTEVNRIQNSKNMDAILKNEYWLPIGYTYKSYMSDEVYHRLDALGKQEAQLQSVILKEEPMLSSLVEEDITTTAQQIPCEVVETSGLTWKDGILTVKENKATMVITFVGVPKTETYLRIVNLDLTNDLSIRNWELTATTGETSTSAGFAADAFPYSHRQKTQMLNMGYTEKGYNAITITFPSKGTYLLDDIEVWCQPMDSYAEQVLALGEEVLENVETNWRGLTGTISVSTDKFLCFSIPYMDGWKAYIDGEKVKLYQANTAFMGLELPAGNHVIELRYWLPGLRMGMILSGIGVVCLIVIVFFQRKRKCRNF